MEIEGTVDLPVVDTEREEEPQVVEIDDPGIPQATSLTTLDIPADPDGTKQVSTLAIEGSRRYTRARSQPDTYAHSTTRKCMNMT